MREDGQKETEVVKFNDLPIEVQLSVESLCASRRKKRLYSLTGRDDKCEDVREKMWAQYNQIIELVKTTFEKTYTHVGVFKTGDLVLVSDKRHEGQAYENGFLLRVPI